ncbi:hypothetical protein DXG01_003808 [Tephrocybe rancida]|nr:hypothetical protein DXG01_003808 [Tephrocybe rancida]
MSESRRLHKAQKTRHNVTEGPEQFLDLEASIEDKSEEENDDSKEDDFIENEEPVATDQSVSHHLLCLKQTRAESDKQWNEFLAHTRLRSRDNQMSAHWVAHYSVSHRGPNISERLFFAEDCCLWRVAVKPGYEETATFILMEKIIRSPSRDWGIKSIIGRVTYPGWVVVEAPNGTDVEELCEGVHNVRSQKISMVEPEEVPFCLQEKNTFAPRSPSWVRLSTSLYKGDLAFVKGYSHAGADLLVVPRLKPPAPGATAGEKRKRSKEKDRAKRNCPTRPDPALFDAQIVAAAWGSQAGKTYMDGLQCLVTDQFYRKEAIPTPSEFEFFRLSQVIPPEFIKHTTNVMASRCLEIGDSVKVVAREAQGAVRKVLNIHYTQASVHIPRDDIQLFVSVDYLSRNIEIGDTVKVEIGEYKGISGLVIASKDDDIMIFDHYTAKHNGLYSESDVAPAEYHSILYNPKYILVERKFPIPVVTNLDFVGCHVHIIGKHQHRKDYTGIIKSMSQDNFVQVELKAALRQEWFHLSALADMDDPDLKPLFVLKPLINDGEASETDGDDLESVWRPHSTEAEPTPRSSGTESTPRPSHQMEIPLSTTPLTASTPFPTSMSLTPAWDPSSETPDPRSKFPSRPWMEHPLMEGKRVKVEIKTTIAYLSNPGWKSGEYEGRLGLWIGIKGKFAQVRLGHDVLDIPPQYIHPPNAFSRDSIVIIQDGTELL